MNINNNFGGIKGLGDLGGQPQSPQISSLNLQKGGTRTLTSLNTNKPLEKICLGLGWNTVKGINVDLDASVLLLGEVPNAYGNVQYQIKNPHRDVIFYGQKNTGCGVVHDGDSRVGNSGGDDETISIDLNAIPTDIKKIVIVITIDRCFEKNQTFAMVSKAYIRVDDMTSGRAVPLVNYDINEKFKFETSLVVAELVRNNQGTWDFKALGEGRNTDINGLFYEFGVR